MTHDAPSEDNTPTEIQQESALSPASAERRSLSADSFCTYCGFDRSGLKDHLGCPQCGKTGSAPRCTFCNYELTGLQVHENCPECGKPIWDSNITALTSGLSIASMVLGIVSLMSCILYGIPALVLGPLAIIFGEISNRQYKNGTRAGYTRGFSITGRICGWIGFAAGGTFIGILIWAISTNAF